MSDIVVSGYYGFGNAGDEAMLAAMIEALTDIEPNVQITVISGNPDDTKRRHGVCAVYRLNYPEIVKALAKSRLLISGGGSLLQDVTSDRSLYYYLSIMMLAKKLNKPVMLYAQGIGPVQGTLAQSAMRYIGNMVDLITVRDDGSYEELKRLKVTVPPIYVTADPVLAMHPVDRQIGRSILRKHGQEGVAPLIGISVREWKEWGHFKQVLSHAADRMIEELGVRVVFIPMQCPDDLGVSQKIAGRMKNKAEVLPGEYTTSELLSLVGNLDLLIGIRLHALIFAAVMHVPMAGISYDPKIDRFLETIGERHVGTLKTVTTDSLMARILQLWDERKHPNKQREERITMLRNKAFQNAELALSLMK
ncbi:MULTISPECIES: polysaccharide pyruvyl transferase CsaB [Sporomusa]|jgi:polysaccharide pyruvyl transferase CsaB|uniref:Colanic acid biosynthesis protein n=1 Tax=Sporomusa sphaeroides DSM 2875 TaxID=1337886 RepID=A0ABM9W5L6_9FIRM|nr:MULTISPECIES: polysaccharide pyruvyl transferase CsaB [Sporomusa]MCM0758959.1 polysaccharide pyruvyl transferase CsaB [Sporomusa sphaeroides DSM 2875]OLS55035.1 colanic acid biosynthesis protein [Sporomusa sphaeroides DSM 2875]CVK19481.1 colanic acid biosynthesis protein [Sporomusa sphaeroides DSM 2875]HML32382.1 polysaccharide pyruvyl transferase CsaB [Sporomusa sphaeroides]